MISFGAVVGRDDRARVRLEGQHGVGAAHHLAVAEVHAVELAHGDLGGVRRGSCGVGEPGDVVPSAAEAYDGLERAVLARLGERDQAVASSTQAATGAPCRRRASAERPTAVARRCAARRSPASVDAPAGSRARRRARTQRPGVGDVERRRCAVRRSSRQ